MSSLGCPRESGPPQPAASCASLGASQPVLLYVTQAAGFRHSVLGHSVDVLESLGETHGFTVYHVENARAAVGALDGCAGIAFYTSGDLAFSADEKAKLLDYVSSGGAFVGFHSATDTNYDWPEYGELVGAYFERHPWNEEVTVEITQPPHESVQALPATFDVDDEIYVFKTFHDTRVEVVASLDLGSVDASGVTLPAWGVPLAWVQEYGDGRVFYTALGHGGVWDDPDYQALVSAGISWTLPP